MDENRIMNFQIKIGINITFKYCCSLLLFFICSSPYAQDDYVNTNRLRYADYTYKDYIKSVQLHQTGWKFSPPHIELNSGQQLELDFDDLNGGYRSYSYTLVHCDADWQPSDLVTLDYIHGFDKDFITDYNNSFNTFQLYTHYRVVIPNDNMQVLYSGNYLIKVFSDNDPDSLILTRRLMIYENKITISGKERQGIGADLFTGQELIFDINEGRYPLSDPFHALQIFILQNCRWDNAISGIQPQFVLGTTLQYESDIGNNFDGGNQFRNFDFTSLKYPTEHIDAFLPSNTGYEIQLKPDVPRPKGDYFTTPDIDGQFLIETKDNDNSNTEADYANIHFYVPLDSEITVGKVYIFGQLSDFECKKEFQMQYDESKKGYVATVYLKQGYYDYEYVLLRNGSNIADASFFEGNHYETQNTYYIYAYYRPFGVYYDKLIGMQSVHAPTN